MPAISAQNLGFLSGSHWALSGVSVELKPGLTLLLGPEGAGKTTFIRLALGLLVPSQGSALLFGSNAHRHPALRRQVGYLPRDFNPPRSLPVTDYVEWLALLSGTAPRSVRLQVIEALDRAGLAGQEQTLLAGLPPELLRRVGLAQAIAHQPGVVIAEEPLAELDAAEQAGFGEILQDLAREKSVLVSSRKVGTPEPDAGEVWFLREGRLVWAGTPSDARDSLRGRVRVGTLPDGELPEGLVISREPSFEGTTWRVLGSDSRLEPSEATLADAYFQHVGQHEKRA